jgi:hypothetical protein
MGSVALGVGDSYISEGYLMHQTVHCLYCDECGSFDIKCLISPPKWLIWTISVIAVVVVAKRAPEFLVLAGLLPVMILLLTSDALRHLFHICRKCRNTHISRGNVLNYPEYDTSILDVPYEVTLKYYTDEY